MYLLQVPDSMYVPDRNTGKPLLKVANAGMQMGLDNIAWEKHWKILRKTRE